jgi:CelD/BcsL family acetyltransferase involved in cellulose biosynthesis
VDLKPEMPATGFDLAPVAPAVGPFPGHQFLSAWWRHLAPPSELVIRTNGHGLVPLHLTGSELSLLGDWDHTDYHSPLGVGADELLAEVLTEVPSGTRFLLDSLPAEACEVLVAGIERTGAGFQVVDDVAAMVIDLPVSMMAYLDGLDAKQRHELRRKRRRYEAEIGPVVHQTHFGAGSGFDEFVRLHRLAPGRKGAFFNNRRLAFFADLAGQPGWRTDLLAVGGRASACLFGWSDDRHYYLYNSSYDPDQKSASPGNVLLMEMIEHSTKQGWGRFDFLKGTEPYKAQLGARPRPLYKIEGRT